MSMQKEIIEEIAEHLAVTPQDIDLSATLTEDMGLGPIEIADLLSALSARFQVTFDPEEVDSVRTVHDLIVMVEDQTLE